MSTLSPLAEEPTSEEESISVGKRNSFRSWLKRLQLFHRKSNLKALLSVLACPLSPLSISPKQPFGVASSAEYIIQQFRATSGCSKVEGKTVKNMFVVGRVAMAGNDGRSGGGDASTGEAGSFVMWQMSPAMWLINLKVAGLHVSAGSDGNVAWRRTPWLGAHSAKGGVRPLRRALQGLDPMTIASIFCYAQHVGDRQIDEEECFVLRLEVDASKLSYQSDNTVEIIEHVLFGCFSERSGLLLHLEDSQLMRIQCPGVQSVFWKTTISSWMKDYEPTNGVMVARSGRSVVSLERFGVATDRTVCGLSMIMEEKWIIDDVDFDVPGLSADFFIPPEMEMKLS